MAGIASRSVLFLALLFWGVPFSALSADPLRIQMFLVPERTICHGRASFESCEKIDNDNIDAFLSRVRAKASVALEFPTPPEELNLTGDGDEGLAGLSLIAAAERSNAHPGIAVMAAVFFLDLPAGIEREIIFRHRGAADKIDKSPGRYVTWISASDADPRNAPEFTFVVAGETKKIVFFQQ